MTGSPRKRVKQTEAAREQAEKEEAQRQYRVRNGVPLPGDVKATGKPFTPETARKAAVARKRKREENAQNPKDAQITVKDEAEAVKKLRALLKSVDERTAKDAAIKLLEYSKGRPAPQNDAPAKIVFESAYVNPDLAS